MEANVTVKKEVERHVCKLKVHGVLDYSTMDPFQEQIQSIEIGTEKVIVDFTELDFIDSTGIGTIINLVHEASDKQFEIALVGFSEETKELLEMMGVFEILKTLQKEAE